MRPFPVSHSLSMILSLMRSGVKGNRITDLSSNGDLGHPHREAWLKMGRQFKQQWFGEYAPPEEQEGYPPHGNTRVQVIRSVSDWSHGVLTEKSIQNACESSILPFGPVDL